MKRYLNIVKGEFMGSLMYPFSLFFTLIGNLIYITVIFFLWRQIYGTADTLHGMTFNQTFIYLTLAGSILILFRNYTDWSISNQIINGGIIMQLVRPLDYELFAMATAAGYMLFNAIIITLPSVLIVFIFFHASLPLGINLLFFLPSIILSYILSFSLDYMTGLTAFYTESIWGISTTKDVIVSTLSGALIPLQFFPDSIRHILQYLPFQAIYNTPLQIITASNLGVGDYIQMIGVQLLWVIVLVALSRLYYSRSIRVLTVNGG